MSDKPDLLASALSQRLSDVLRTSDHAARLLSTAVSAAAARALTAAPSQSTELVLRRLVFTMDRELEESAEAIRAQAYPLADPLGASLDLAVRGTSRVGVAVEVFDARGFPLATVTTEFSIRAAPT